MTFDCTVFVGEFHVDSHRENEFPVSSRCMISFSNEIEKHSVPLWSFLAETWFTGMESKLLKTNSCKGMRLS